MHQPASAEESQVDHKAHMTRNPEVCGGEPVVIGTRVTVRTILASRADGDSRQELLGDFPTLTEPDICAAIAYAAASGLANLGAAPVPSADNLLEAPDGY